jgi:hypothetical protein
MKYYKRSIEGILTFHKLLKIKAKRHGIKGYFHKQSIGDEFCKDRNKYVWKSRVIDRLLKLYKEIVKDKETGEIIHQCEEPLNKHIGHGSDKR